jgi:hypothetical protein
LLPGDALLASNGSLIQVLEIVDHQEIEPVFNFQVQAACTYAARRRDPFQAYFDLWSSGVSYSFRTADSCRYLIRPSVADLEGSRRR